jgi:hypothetical protein
MKMPERSKISRGFFKHPFWLLWIAVLTASGCRNDEPAPSPIDIFYKKMSSLQMEVAYEQGAEPYAISSSGDNVWEFSEMNIESLFIQRPFVPDVFVPSGLGEMTAIPAQNKSGYTVDNILGLANHYRKRTGSETDGNIFVLFLNGYFQKSDTLQTGIMGVHVTGTTVTAVFKPVIRSLFIGTAVKEYIEQSVVIHEIGHVLGLVNAGLPLTSPHEDGQHQAHCSNESCVMYWENEGVNVAAFIQNYNRGRRLLFGPECVADVTGYQP